MAGAGAFVRVGPPWHAARMPDLTDTQRAMLDLEGHWFRYAGAKDAIVRERWGISATRYYQLLGALLDDPAALAYAPRTVRRLVRLREARRAVRAGR